MVQNDRGGALIAVLLVTIMLSLLALSLSLSSMTDIQISSEFENHEKALLIADAGFNAVRKDIHGDLDALLAEPVSVKDYIPGETMRPFDYRNPISLREARNVDFALNPSAGTRNDTGWLTPPEGVEISGGRYFAKLTDNDDGDGNRLLDKDGTLLLRVIGVSATLPTEADPSGYGSNRKNAVAVIEAMLVRDGTFEIESPLTIPAASVESPFGGAKFKVDGYDHSSIWETTDDIGSHSENGLPSHAAVNVVYDDPPQNSEKTVDEIIKGLSKNEKDNFTGIPDQVPSIIDGTVAVKNDPDSKKILNPVFLESFVKYVGNVADEKVKDGQQPKGGYGTEVDPRIIMAEGDLKITGNGTGYGLMVVQGELEFGGNFSYNGMLLVVGEGSMRVRGAASILGGMLIANIQADHTLGQAKIDVHGGGNPEAGVYNSSSQIKLALSLLPFRTLSWREITPEIEP